MKLATYPIAKLLINNLFRDYLFRKPASVRVSLPVVLTGVLTVGFLNYNPFYLTSLKKREDILDVLEKRIGYKVLNLNDMLPRFWTETGNKLNINIYIL